MVSYYIYSKKAPHGAFSIHLRSQSSRAEHRLGLQKLLKSQRAPLAAQAGLFVAAEWCAGVAARAVQMHVAGAQLRGNHASGGGCGGVDVA